jgi:hypothetical protein
MAPRQPASPGAGQESRHDQQLHRPLDTHYETISTIYHHPRANAWSRSSWPVPTAREVDHWTMHAHASDGASPASPGGVSSGLSSIRGGATAATSPPDCCCAARYPTNSSRLTSLSPSVSIAWNTLSKRPRCPSLICAGSDSMACSSSSPLSAFTSSALVTCPSTLRSTLPNAADSAADSASLTPPAAAAAALPRPPSCCCCTTASASSSDAIVCASWRTLFTRLPQPIHEAPPAGTLHSQPVATSSINSSSSSASTAAACAVSSCRRREH